MKYAISWEYDREDGALVGDSYDGGLDSDRAHSLFSLLMESPRVRIAQLRFFEQSKIRAFYRRPGLTCYGVGDFERAKASGARIYGGD